MPSNHAAEVGFPNALEIASLAVIVAKISRFWRAQRNDRGFVELGTCFKRLYDGGQVLSRGALNVVGAGFGTCSLDLFCRVNVYCFLQIQQAGKKQT